MRYCDGGSFAGDGEGEDRNGTKLFYRGLRIWEAVVDELMAKGMDTAEQKRFFRRKVHTVHLQWSCSPSECAKSFVQGLPYKEGTDRELIKSISTPTFIRNSGYDSYQVGNVLAPGGSDPGQSWARCKADVRNCTSTQIEALNGFRRELVEDLKVAQHKRGWGLFIDSCFNHCQTPFGATWHSPISLRLGNKTIAEAVADWYVGENHGVEEIDCAFPCINPTCSSQLDL